MSSLPTTLAVFAADLIDQVGESLAMLQNGHHGAGAGIVWGQDAQTGSLILTNFHVIAHGRQVRVILPDGSEFPAQVVAQAPEYDLALIRIPAKDLKAVKIADSRELRVGQLVYAVGHPWGQRGAVTAGMISSLGNIQPRGRKEPVPVIRSDARLAPGNSGGPLIDANGAVVGINTMIIGGDQGIALPIHIAAQFVENALEKS